jgi:hypothetical protein
MLRGLLHFIDSQRLDDLDFKGETVGLLLFGSLSAQTNIPAAAFQLLPATLFDRVF